MPTDPVLWSHKNISDIIWYLDPDQIAHFFATLVEHEKDTIGDYIDNLMLLIDPDTCPEQYLQHLASVVGVKLYEEDRVETWRAQIRSAVRWYKEKGKISSFTILFRTMGMNPEIYPLWINREGNVAREPLDPSYKPHARIDLVIREYPEWKRYLPEKLQFVLNRMEEVRPIHVLLRGIFLGWDFFDIYPFDEIVDEMDNIVHATPTDQFASVYMAYCGLWHHATPQPRKLRDGGGYAWKDSVKDILTTPPLTVTAGDRYIVAETGATGDFAGHENEIAEYDGVSWTFTPPQLNWALWVKRGMPPIEAIKSPGDWRAYFWNGIGWQNEWQLFEGRTAPGPFFRECRGNFPCPDVNYICDQLEGTISFNPPPDPFEYCMFHDASVTGVPGHPYAGGIQKRDGTYYHNCRKVFDKVEWDVNDNPISASDTFDPPTEGAEHVVSVDLEDSAKGLLSKWDNPLLEWDSPLLTWDFDGLAIDYLEIWITDHSTSNPPYLYTGQISNQ